MSLVLGNTLHIWVGANLDQLARERYIQAKLDQHGIKRRRGLIALLPLAGGHAAGHSKTATGLVAGGGAIAVGVAAAALLPVVLNDGQDRRTQPPSAAAPAPTRPAPPRHSHPPASAPPKAPRQPDEAAPSNPPLQIIVPAHAVSVSVPRVPGLNPSHPNLPASPPVHLPQPVTRRQTPLLAVSLPRARIGVRVSVSPRLSVGADLGSRRLRLRLGAAATATSAVASGHANP